MFVVLETFFFNIICSIKVFYCIFFFVCLFMIWFIFESYLKMKLLMNEQKKKFNEIVEMNLEIFHFEEGTSECIGIQFHFKISYKYVEMYSSLIYYCQCALYVLFADLTTICSFLKCPKKKNLWNFLHLILNFL